MIQAPKSKEPIQEIQQLHHTPDLDVSELPPSCSCSDFLEDGMKVLQCGKQVRANPKPGDRVCDFHHPRFGNIGMSGTLPIPEWLDGLHRELV